MDEDLLLRYFIVYKTLILELHILIFKHIINFQTYLNFLHLTLLISLGCHDKIPQTDWLKQ